MSFFELPFFRLVLYSYLMRSRYCCSANKHWNGLIRDFYAKRVGCYIVQASIDIPLTPLAPSACKLGKLVTSTYLAGYPHSLPGCDGIHPPTKWPYALHLLSEAKKWCCAHADCGGVTHQNGRYEVRAVSVKLN